MKCRVIGGASPKQSPSRKRRRTGGCLSAGEEAPLPPTPSPKRRGGARQVGWWNGALGQPVVGALPSVELRRRPGLQPVWQVRASGRRAFRVLGAFLWELARAPSRPPFRISPEDGSGRMGRGGLQPRPEVRPRHRPATTEGWCAWWTRPRGGPGAFRFKCRGVFLATRRRRLLPAPTASVSPSPPTISLSVRAAARRPCVTCATRPRAGPSARRCLISTGFPPWPSAPMARCWRRVATTTPSTCGTARRGAHRPADASEEHRPFPRLQPRRQDARVRHSIEGAGYFGIDLVDVAARKCRLSLKPTERRSASARTARYW